MKFDFYAKENTGKCFDESHAPKLDSIIAKALMTPINAIKTALKVESL